MVSTHLKNTSHIGCSLQIRVNVEKMFETATWDLDMQRLHLLQVWSLLNQSKLRGLSGCMDPLNKRFASGYFLSLGTSTGSVFTYLTISWKGGYVHFGKYSPENQHDTEKKRRCIPYKKWWCSNYLLVTLVFWGGGVTKKWNLKKPKLEIHIFPFQVRQEVGTTKCC